MMFRSPPAWVLVLTGLVLNVLALLMSSIVLDKLSGDIGQLSEQKDENIYSIQLAWNSVEMLERKREMLLLHIAHEGEVQQQLQATLQGQLSQWVNQPIPEINLDNLPQLMMLINQAQQLYRNQIDDFYLENLSISELMTTLNERIAWYKNIGLFLQVFGLALILARDLARKPN
ncbi:DNA mismatch repair protein [Vibrio europaeus]|uniref:DNA mismatch repair protein n=1 Tax=Vibrio europaeus TaxID=300876 RepID=UPI00233F6E9C|nr:DNA mismatch repair protein [Vibrio europaeus]MDC5856855.1 DNA mismatch repair protein [Vibrio europaeus]